MAVSAGNSRSSEALDRFALNRDLHMYPYSERVSKLMARAVRALYGR